MSRRVLFALVVGLVGTGILVGLGIWQVQRLAWKEGVLADIEARIAADPAAIPAAPDPEGDRYSRWSLMGRSLTASCMCSSVPRISAQGTG